MKTHRAPLALLRPLMTAALGFGLLGLVACNGAQTTTDGTEATAAADEAAAAPVKAHGPQEKLFDRAAALDLRADQKTALASIRTRLETETAPTRAAHQALNAELASQVRAGKIDEARLQPLQAKVEAAHEAERGAHQAAMKDLHDLLDSTQRDSLMTAMASERADHAKGEAEDGRGHRGRPGMRPFHMLKGLNLTDAQKTAIHAALPARPERTEAAKEERAEKRTEMRGEMQARMEKMAAAFRSDSFDPAEMAPPAGRGERFGKPMEGHMTQFLSAAVPVLDQSQREQLAQKLESKGVRG